MKELMNYILQFVWKCVIAWVVLLGIGASAAIVVRGYKIMTGWFS